MKVLLVSSPIALHGIENLTRLPNLGLNSIAAGIDNEKHELKIADLVACRKDPVSYLKRVISTFRPDIVGFSAMTFQYPNAVMLAGEIKKSDPDIKTVLGGYHATTAFKEILQSDDMKVFDFIVRGEGEKAFTELLSALAKGEDTSKIPGLSYLNEKGEKINTPNRDLTDINLLKLPARDFRLLDNRFHFLGKKADVIETSRGCTLGCDYCSINCMYGKKFRTYNLYRVIQDIKSVKSKGAEFILLADDNIALDTKRLIRLCELIIEENLSDINYVIQVGMKELIADKRLPEIMTEAGMKYIFLAMENIKNDSEKSHKPPEFKYDEIFNVISAFRNRGAFIMGGFILGFPDDKEEDLWDTYRFAKKSGVDMVSFMILTPLPGTRIRETLLQEGLVTNKNSYSKYSHINANIKTKYLSSNQLSDIAEKMNARFLIERGTFFRLLFRFPIHITSRLIIEFFKAPGMLMERIKGMFSVGR